MRRIIVATLCLLVLLPQAAALADPGYHWVGPFKGNRGFEGFTGTYEAAAATGSWSGFVVTRSMLNEGGSVGWLELGWSDSWSGLTPTGPTVYTCGGDRFGCPGNGTQMYGRLYPEFEIVPGNNYRFRVESCYFSDATWGSCAFFWNGQDGYTDTPGTNTIPVLPGTEGGEWVLLEWKYSLCKSNRRCGAADTQTEVWTTDLRKPTFSVDVPKVTTSNNGGQTLDNSTNYNRSRWTTWGGCPGSHDEYPLVTTDATYVKYNVSSGVNSNAGVCGGGLLTTTMEEPDIDLLKGVLPGSEPPAEPQPGLPIPVIAEDSNVIVYPGPGM